MASADFGFIGIDLAWKVNANHTGIVALVGNKSGVEIAAVARAVTSERQIVEFVAAHSRHTTVVAIDASLVVSNATGQRLCERDVGRRFGAYGASCHSTSQSRRYWDTGPRLVKSLAAHQFQHDFAIETARARSGRWIFEVYPHPAMIQLFGLTQILSYKKGLIETRRDGLSQLQSHLRSLTAGAAGLRENAMLRVLLAQDPTALKGSALKHHEDTLDALFCAYLAWHCWRWGEEKNEMFGTLRDGYIVLPRGHIE